VREAQDSFGHSTTLPHDQCGIGPLLMIWCFAPTYRGLGLSHMLTTAAGAADGTEFHSIRCHTHDIANRCPA
jgi:hypothetical protein